VSGTSRREASALAEVFERLFKSYRSEIFRTALRSSRNREDAEDLTQTTFLNAYAALQRGAEPEAPRAWLHAIARNAGNRRLRRARILEVELDPEVSPALEEDLTAVHELQSALARLTFNQRASLLMREVGGLSASEIGARLGISPGAVATLLFRARRALRAELDAVDKPTKSRLRLGVLYATLVRPAWTRLAAPIFDGGDALTRSAAAVGVVAAAAGVTVFTGATGSPPAPAGHSHARTALAARPDVAVPKASLLPVVRAVQAVRVPGLPRIRFVHAPAAHPVARAAAPVSAAPAARRGSPPAPPQPAAGAQPAAPPPAGPATVPAAPPAEPVEPPPPQPSVSTPSAPEPSAAAPARPAGAPEPVQAVTKPVQAAEEPVQAATESVQAVTAPVVGGVTQAVPSAAPVTSAATAAVGEVSQVTSAVPAAAVPAPSTAQASADAVPAPVAAASAAAAPVAAPPLPAPPPAAQLPTG
jgi:RNA polymerase sigma factor (sigma-70 family)